jgi:PEP-CTERM motif
MKTRFFRPLATMISLLLLVAVPAQASPIKFADVVNVMGDLQKSSQIEQLRLRTVAQDPNGQTPSSASKSLAGPTAPAIDTDVQTAAPSLIAGAEVAPQQPQGEVQVFEQDNVDGTICDCGEIPAVGGGFPKWPFLFLAAIPLLFIHHHHNECPTCNTCPTCPTPTPTPPPQVPEPASLLLFGSGIVALTAGARRRYAKMRARKQAATMTEV